MTPFLFDPISSRYHLKFSDNEEPAYKEEVRILEKFNPGVNQTHVKDRINVIKEKKLNKQWRLIGGYMRIILLLVALLFLVPNIWGCQNSDVSIRMVSHRRVPPESHADPLQVREVTWRMTNKSSCSIYVIGHQVSKFYPIGVTLTYFSTSRKWESPFGSKIPSPERLGTSGPDQFKVKPGDSLDFINRLGDAEPSVKFKHVVYVSIGNSKAKPNAIVSPIFFFNRKLD